MTTEKTNVTKKTSDVNSLYQTSPSTEVSELKALTNTQQAMITDNYREIAELRNFID
jgi:hypothetical protein